MKVPVDWVEIREDGTAADDGLGIAFDYLKELM
jgi:hypothetical protein